MDDSISHVTSLSLFEHYNPFDFIAGIAKKQNKSNTKTEASMYSGSQAVRFQVR